MNSNEVMDTDNPGFSDFENQGPVYDENARVADHVGSMHAASSLLAAAEEWENQAQGPSSQERDSRFLYPGEQLSTLGVASPENIVQAPSFEDHVVPDWIDSLGMESSRSSMRGGLLSDAVEGSSTAHEGNTSENELISASLEIVSKDLEFYKRFCALQSEEIAELRDQEITDGLRRPKRHCGCSCRCSPTM